MTKKQLTAVAAAMQILHDAGVQSIVLTTVAPYNVVAVCCESSGNPDAKLALSHALAGIMLTLPEEGSDTSEEESDVKESATRRVNVVKTRRDFIRIVQAIRLTLIAYPDVHLKPLIILDQMKSLPLTIPKVSKLSVDQLHLIRDAIAGEINDRVVSSLLALTAIILNREKVDAFDTRS